MTHRMALLASLMLATAAPCGAQSPASDATATSAASSAKPAPSTASSSATSSATVPATAAAGTDTTATAATADSKPASSETTASSEPSAEVLKEARREGFKPKKRDGVTKFCYTAAPLGTRFESETCVDEAHLKMAIEQREDTRNLLRQQGACSGSNCSGR
jgi:hypothetical protein